MFLNEALKTSYRCWSSGYETSQVKQGSIPDRPSIYCAMGPFFKAISYELNKQKKKKRKRKINNNNTNNTNNTNTTTTNNNSNKNLRDTFFFFFYFFFFTNVLFT